VSYDTSNFLAYLNFFAQAMVFYKRFLGACQLWLPFGSKLIEGYTYVQNALFFLGLNISLVEFWIGFK
jgi:hypothetical protein